MFFTATQCSTEKQDKEYIRREKEGSYTIVTEAMLGRQANVFADIFNLGDSVDSLKGFINPVTSAPFPLNFLIYSLDSHICII
jgi:hypothetical protein